MENDADRYRRFLRGDDNGLREIIDSHYNALTLYINGIVHDPSETEEIVQDTFVRIAVKKPKFSEKSSFRTWLFTIARNTAYNYLRRHRSRIADQPIDTCIMLSDGTDVEREHLRDEQKIELHRAMRKLHADYFQVLYLMYFEELDTAEIAAVMHKSKRQVGDLLYRAKQSLKTILERAGFDYEEF